MSGRKGTFSHESLFSLDSTTLRNSSYFQADYFALSSVEISAKPEDISVFFLFL